MEILINELSLDSQFSDKEDFFNNLISILELIKIIDKLNFQILKDQMLFNCRITKKYQLIDLLKLKTKTNELRKLKSNLVKLSNNPPFWQNDQKHNCDKDSYYFKNKDICSTSLAESFERDKIILSFKHNDYLKTFLNIKKNNDTNKLFNIIKREDFLDYLLSNSKIEPLTYCLERFKDSNLNFTKLDKRFSFNSLNTKQIKEFINNFLMFSKMNWKDIEKSDGLKYKKYKPNKKDDWFENLKQNIYKFRITQKYRCFGYKEKNQFYILAFEINHKKSDKG